MMTKFITDAANAGKSISQQKLAEQIYQIPCVEDCYITTGKSDIYVHVFVNDMDDLNDFIINKLRNMPGVENTETAVVLMDVSDRTKKKPVVFPTI